MRMSDWSSDVCSSDLLNGDPYYGYRDDLYEHVSTQLARFGTPVDGARINLVKGLFEETLPSLDIERIAFAHIDCDWYDPVRYCLDETSRRLAPGGIIVIDDYNDYEGCRVAVDEFRSEEHTSELQSLMRISYAVFCLNNKKYTNTQMTQHPQYT